MATYTCVVQSDAGHSHGADGRKERRIEASSPAKAAEKAVRQWQRERSLFLTDAANPDVVVDGVEYVHAEYAMPNDKVWDWTM